MHKLHKRQERGRRTVGHLAVVVELLDELVLVFPPLCVAAHWHTLLVPRLPTHHSVTLLLFVLQLVRPIGPVAHHQLDVHLVAPLRAG